MTDEEILKDREEKYGSPDVFFKTYGDMCRLLDSYAEASSQDPIDEGHLSALKMVLLKVKYYKLDYYWTRVKMFYLLYVMVQSVCEELYFNCRELCW